MALPSGYRRLKYIESDGNQWCHIGVNGQSGISVETKIKWNEGRVFIGSTTADDKTRCFPTFKYGNGNYFGYGYVTTYQASKAVVYGTDYTIETDFKVGAQSMKVNGEVIKTTANATSFNNGFPLCLFATNFGGTIQDKGSFRCEYCKVRLNGTLVSDLIPCQNPSGVAGLWDNVENVFLASEGSKAFIAGPEIVIGEDRFPVSYRKLPFIGSTGTQYVNTNVIPTTETRVVIEFELTSPPANASTWHSVFGSRTSSGSGDQFNIATDSQNSYAGFASQEITVTQPYNKANTRYVVDISKNGVIVNGVKAGTYNSGLNVVSSYPMYVFGRNNAGTFGNGITGNVMSMQIYINGSLIRDYIPCETDSGEVGLWDTVDLRFYGNAGTGAFINPLAPVGDHNTYISGVARGIDGMTVNIGGASIGVRGGTVLIGGVVREFEFEPSVFTVTVTGNYTSNYYATATMNGTRLLPGNSHEVEEGTQIVCTVKSDAVASTQRAYIYLNGVLLDPYTHTLTVSGNVTIDLSCKITSKYTWGIITITTS